MRVRDYFGGLGRSFVANRSRSLLTLLGIVIGTGSIVMLAGLLRGAEEALAKLQQGINDSDTMRIRSDDPPQAQMEKTRRELSRADGWELDASRQLPDVDVAIESRKEALAHYRGKQKRVRLMGGSPESLELYRLTMAKGRFLDPEDLRDGNRYAVVGHEIWQELLEETPAPLGIQLTIDDRNWTIVGVLAHKPKTGHGDGTWMWDRRVVVPQTAYDAELAPDHRVNSILLRVKRTRPGEQFMAAIGGAAEKVLLRRHLGVKNFSMDDREGANQERLIITIIEILLLGTGLLSMFVGGINIMNIMLVTVTERTREIGIRRAIGAGPRAILAQFVLEAGAVSLFGGLLGVAGGISLCFLIGLGLEQLFGNWTFYVVPWSIGLGLGLAVFTGVVFGLFPAWRASRLNPVDALRFE